MNKSENRRTGLKLKSFFMAALAFSLFASSGHFASVIGQSSGEVWTFKEVRVFKRMDGRFGNVVREHFDLKGGSVDINLSGNIANFCPGGAETLRFNWKFPDNIERVSQGAGVGVSLEAGQIGRGGTCQSALAARSYFYAGGANPFTEQDRERWLFEEGRFYNIETPKPVAHTEFGGKTVGFAKIGVNDRVPSAEKPLAGFEISINVPTDPGGGWVRYVYIYERGGKRYGGMKMEYDIALDGSTLTYYPRSSVEQCQNDCANNANCKGFTWIRAGAYNPGDSAMCYLLSAVTRRNPARGHISGIK